MRVLPPSSLPSPLPLSLSLSALSHAVLPTARADSVRKRRAREGERKGVCVCVCVSVVVLPHASPLGARRQPTASTQHSAHSLYNPVHAGTFVVLSSLLSLSLLSSQLITRHPPPAIPPPGPRQAQHQAFEPTSVPSVTTSIQAEGCLPHVVVAGGAASRSRPGSSSELAPMGIC